MKDYKTISDEEMQARKARGENMLRDGECFRVPTLLADGFSLARAEAVNRAINDEPATDPYARTLPVSDAEYQRRAAQVTAKNERLTEAWKNTPPLASFLVAKPAPATMAPAGDVYAKRDRKLEDAWRGVA